jgi:hypothetical protein
MRPEERTPLSGSGLHKRLMAETRAAVVNALVPLLFVTLLAAGFTAIIAQFYSAAPPVFRVLLVICALPLWIGAAILLHRLLAAMKLYRASLPDGIIRIETDTVSNLTEEFPSVNSRSQSKLYVVYLTNRGRCVINSALWCILHEGDEVYVAVTDDTKPRVFGVYSTLTHRIAKD